MRRASREAAGEHSAVNNTQITSAFDGDFLTQCELFGSAL